MLTVHAEDIRWIPAPLPAPDLLVLDDEQVAVAALADAESYRALLLVALAQFADQQQQLAARAHTIAQLRDENRRYIRAQIGAAA